MSKKDFKIEWGYELPKDYKFVNKIECCEPKLDFDTNTIVDKILSTRTKKVDEEVIRLLKSIGEERGINELIVIDESKVLNMIKAVRALEIIRNIGILKPYETIGGQCWLETMCDATKITKDNCDLLKEVLS